MPSIENVLEGRHFSVVGFSGVRTINIVNIIVEIHSQEYNVYSRTNRQRAQAPRSKVLSRAGTFPQLDFGGCAL